MDPFTQFLSRKQQVVFFLAATLPLIAVLLIVFFGPLPLLKLAAAAVLVGGLGFLILALPETGIYLAVFYIFSGVGVYFHLPAAHAVMLTTVLGVGVKIYLGEKVQFENGLFNWSAFLFTLIALTSVLWAYSPGLSFWRFVRFFQVLIIALTVVQLIRSPRRLEYFTAVIFWSAVLTVLLGVLNIMLGIATDISMAGYANLIRFEGTQRNPNAFGMYLTTALPLGFYLIKRASGWIPRLLNSLAVVILVLAVLASFSRSAMFPLAFVLLASIFREVRTKKLYIGIAVLIALGYLLTPAYYWERFSTVAELGESIQKDSSIYLRILAAKSALALFAQHPLTGIGFQNFMVRSSPILRGVIYAHNGYLELLAGVGLFGFLAWAGMIFAGLRGCFRSFRGRWPGETVPMNNLAFYMLVALISALINNLFDSAEFNYFLWVPLAGGLAVGNIQRRRVDPSNR